MPMAGHDSFTFVTRNIAILYSGWKQGVGFVTEQMIRDHLPVSSATDSIILMCGPPPMLKAACEPSLDKLDYPASQRFTF